MSTPDAFDQAMLAAVQETAATFVEIHCLAHDSDGHPTQYSVEFSHRFRVDAGTPVEALAAGQQQFVAAVRGGTRDA